MHLINYLLITNLKIAWVYSRSTVGSWMLNAYACMAIWSYMFTMFNIFVSCVSMLVLANWHLTQTGLVKRKVLEKKFKLWTYYRDLQSCYKSYWGNVNVSVKFHGSPSAIIFEIFKTGTTWSTVWRFHPRGLQVWLKAWRTVEVKANDLGSAIDFIWHVKI